MKTNKGNARNPRATGDSERFSERERTAPRTARSSTSLRGCTNSAPSNRRPSVGRASSGTRGSRLDGNDGNDGNDGQDGSSRYSRRISQAEYRNRQKKNRRRKITIGAIAAVLVLCLGGVGVALAYYNGISSSLHAGVTDELRQELVKTDLAKEPFYMLLMGTDGSSDRASTAEYAGDQFRADSMILARIDPVSKKVTLLSIHRDTLVDMGEYGQNKINAAHAIGGAALTVKTVSELAGVPISHYAEINFDGFRDIVNALGGVEVEVPMEIDDEDAGGYLAQGLQTLNGDQALILCRARHAYDDFGDGDSYRAANQRLVLGAIAKKLLSSDIGTIAASVGSLAGYVTTDLEITDIVGLAQTMQGLDPATDLYSAMEPTTSAYVDDIWYEYTNMKAWQAMIARVEQGLPPTEADVVDAVSGTVLATTGSGEAAGGSSSTSAEGNASNASATDAAKSGKVAIQNGNGIAGAASKAGDSLGAVGYTVETGNAEGFDYSQTIVIYNHANQANEAKEIATTIGVGKAQLNDGNYSFKGDFLVVLGADWK